MWRKITWFFWGSFSGIFCCTNNTIFVCKYSSICRLWKSKENSRTAESHQCIHNGMIWQIYITFFFIGPLLLFRVLMCVSVCSANGTGHIWGALKVNWTNVDTNSKIYMLTFNIGFHIKVSSIHIQNMELLVVDRHFLFKCLACCHVLLYPLRPTVIRLMS